MKTERKTKARRAYNALFEAANKLRFVNTYDLLKIAKAINPALERDGELLILDDSFWTDGSLAPGLMTLHREWASQFGSARALLVFFREREMAWRSQRCHHDIRLVYSFERGEKGGSCWLDCQTGLPWLPRACHDMRRHLDEQGLRKSQAVHSEEYKIAQRTLSELNHEIAWCHTDMDWQNERFVEGLLQRSRRDYWSEWKTERVLAVRLHPPGSLIHDPKEREDWLAAYRSRQLAEMEVSA